MSDVSAPVRGRPAARGSLQPWAWYLLVGVLFGAFDFFYLGWLERLDLAEAFGGAPAVRLGQVLVLNLGLWLVPVVPVARHAARRSRSWRGAALASVAVWCAAIVAYYLANAVYLFLWGLPTRPELHISHRADPAFWANWASVFQGDILGGMLEWLIVAVVGGAVVGALLGVLTLGRRPRST